MIRPCYLVVDTEHHGSISTRKLVIETAKLNVVTAYSGGEAIETLAKYPALDAVVMDATIGDFPCDQLIEKLKTIQPRIPVIVISGPSNRGCDKADHVLQSFQPGMLLELLRRLQPEIIGAIAEHDAELGDSPGQSEQRDGRNPGAATS